MLRRTRCDRSRSAALINKHPSGMQSPQRAKPKRGHSRVAVTLAPLAFVAPRIIHAIISGDAPAGLTVTGLARALPYAWSEQAKQLGIV